MIEQVLMPDIGEGVREGEIHRWLVEPGQSVSASEPAVHVITDLHTLEIPSPRAGRIEALHAHPGDLVPVGSVIFSLDSDVGDASVASTDTKQEN